MDTKTILAIAASANEVGKLNNEKAKHLMVSEHVNHTRTMIEIQIHLSIAEAFADFAGQLLNSLKA